MLLCEGWIKQMSTRPTKYLAGILVLGLLVGISYSLHQLINQQISNLTKLVQKQHAIELAFTDHSLQWQFLTSNVVLKSVVLEHANTKVTAKEVKLRVNNFKTLVNLEPVIDQVSIQQPVVELVLPEQPGDLAYEDLLLSGIQWLRSSALDMRCITLTDADIHLVTKQQDRLLHGLNIQVNIIPDTSNMQNFMVTSDLSVTIHPNALVADLSSFKLQLAARAEVINDLPLQLSMNMQLKDLHYHGHSSFTISNLKADINLLQNGNQAYLIVNNITLAAPDALTLDDLSINLAVDNQGIAISMLSEYLPIAQVIKKFKLSSKYTIRDNTNLLLDEASITYLDASAHFSSGKLTNLQYTITANDAVLQYEQYIYKAKQLELKYLDSAYSLNLPSSYLFIPKSICQQSVRAHPVQAKLSLAKKDSAWQLDVENLGAKICGIDMNATGYVNPQLAHFEMLYKHPSVANLLQDATDEFISSKLLHWLRRAFKNHQSIQGEVNLHGKLANWPFNNSGNDSLQITATVDHANINFSDKWQSLSNTSLRANFINNSYSIEANGGYLGNIPLKQAHTSFKHTDNLTELVVHAAGTTRVEDVLSYLHKSSVSSDVPSQQTLFFSGDAALDITMRIPIHQDVAVEFAGKASIENGSIFNKHTQLMLGEEYIGELSFYKGDVTKAFDPELAQDIHLDISGIIKANFEDSTHAYLRYNSNLSIQYIMPIDHAWKWTINASLDNQRHSIQSIDKNNLVALSRGRLSGNITSKATEITLSGGNGLKIEFSDQANIPQVTVEKCLPSYFKVYRHLQRSLSMSASTTARHPQKIAFSLYDLDIYGVIVKEIQAIAEIHKQTIDFSMQGDEISGNIRYHQLADAWVMHLEKLKLHRTPVKEVQTKLDFANHANIYANIKQLSINNKDLGAVELVYNPRLEQAAYDVFLEELANANLYLHVQATNFNSLLEYLGYQDKLVANKAFLEVKANWPVANGSVDIADIQSTIDIQITNGILNVSSNMQKQSKYLAKLISLLNVSAIPRRLSLDFDDITGDNLVFDSLAGVINLANNTYTTDNLNIISTNAALDIKGSFSSIDHKVQAELAVTPHITGGLPIVAAIAGGPVVGLAALAAKTLIGKNLNKLSTKHYAITGTSDNPAINEIKQFL